MRAVVMTGPNVFVHQTFQMTLIEDGYMIEQVECPASFVPESMRQTGMEGALNGARKEAYSGAGCELATAD